MKFPNNCIMSVSDIQTKLKTINWHIIEKPSNNKGSRGQIIEKALGIQNSSRLKDLIDGELKTFTYGESIACTQLNHCLYEIENNIPFDKSKLGMKMEQTIYIGFSKDNNYIGSTTLNKNTHKYHYIHMEEDYNFISNIIRNTILNKTTLKTITGPNKLLQIRTKASKINGFYKPLIYKGHELKNKYMAFYLCSNFGKKLFNH